MRTLILSVGLVLLAADARAQARMVQPENVVVPGAIAVIVAGQSNAVGRGAVLAEDRIPEPNVYVMKGTGYAYEAADPLSWLTPGVGYGRTLARELLAAGYSQVWIVQCAVSNTSVLQWSGATIGPLTAIRYGDGALLNQVGGRFYTGCLLQALPLTRLGVRILAVAWHQGESGCRLPGIVSRQQAELERVNERFKADFPGVVLVAGELARSYACVNRIAVNDANRAAADGFVESDGLPTGLDGVHFTREAQRELGRRYGQEILRITLTRPAVAP